MRCYDDWLFRLWGKVVLIEEAVLLNDAAKFAKLDFMPADVADRDVPVLTIGCTAILPNNPYHLPALFAGSFSRLNQQTVKLVFAE